MENPLRQNLWRAGHAHAGVLLVLSLVALRYVDEARLFLPVAFFLSVLRPEAREPNGLIYQACLGAVLLAIGSWSSA